MNKQRRKPTKRPPARKPRNRRVSLTPSLGAPVEHKGGRRVRAWLSKNTGLVCIAVGWVFAFAALAVPKTHDNVLALFELAVAATAFFFFGLGWIVRGERGGDADK